MPKSRTEKIANYDEQIAKLQDQRKKELQRQQQEERKARENRYKKRHKLLEDALPETIGMTDEKYKTFLTKHVANEYGRKTLASIIAQGTKTVAEKQDTATAPSDNATP